MVAVMSRRAKAHKAGSGEWWTPGLRKRRQRRFNAFQEESGTACALGFREQCQGNLTRFRHRKTDRTGSIARDGNVAAEEGGGRSGNGEMSAVDEKREVEQPTQA
ncbi:hypothetical protein RRG08_053450 [Elysia crispata]|uniref:Uncharacterized protein n=1 Tax=Elysia crispata TaxID=231223 RepID=A0AAE0YJL1_9GAST|nr:hypothetical protein RRG08_053450 [Elysia crispata]